MQYRLIKAEKNDEEKLNKNKIPAYKMIVIDDKIFGCVRVIEHEDGVLLDELFIEEEFRNNGIGSSILKDILRENPLIYLLKLGFKVIKEEEMREFMKYQR